MKLRKVLILLGVLGFAPPAFALTANSPYFLGVPNRGLVRFVQGTDSPGTAKTLYTVASGGSRCTGIFVSNNDAGAAHLVTITDVNGGVTYLLGGLITVSPASTTVGPVMQQITSVPSAPGILPLPRDGTGNDYIQGISGDVFKINFATAFSTTGSEIDVYASCGDFQ